MNNRKTSLITTLTLLGAGLTSPGALAMEHGCAASARSLFLACGYDVAEGYLGGLAICIDTNDTTSADACVADVGSAREEDTEECGEVLEARLEVCEKTDDAIHDAPFGEDFADNFVDPREIGSTIDPNPWLPLIPGNFWVYEASGTDEDGEPVEETITVRVTSGVKMIEGVPCLVVNDTVDEDGEVIEDTDDWFAQDADGNVWYCGEISKNHETFDGDEPEIPELVDLEGSWKSGRDGGEAGMLLPFAPVVGTTIRQEVLFSDAEDVIDIESLEGTETSAAASCTGTCLVTRDYTPLEPGELENKYYVAGIGLIVETKPGTDERLELVEYGNEGE